MNIFLFLLGVAVVLLILMLPKTIYKRTPTPSLDKWNEENYHGRTITKEGIFNRYEVTKQNYYGLCGFTKYEVDVCIGIATFDSHRMRLNGVGIKVPSEKNYHGFILPSNYKLIKSDFIKKDE